MRRLNIHHVTEYRFSAPVSLLPHRLLLRPRENHNVRIESSVLEIFPAHSLQWKRDVLDNSVAVVAFPEPADRLRIRSNVVIQHYEENPFDFLVDDYAVNHPFDYAKQEQADLAPFREAVYPADREAVQRWLDGLGLLRPMQTFTLLDRVNREILGRFFYQMREEPGVQTPSQTLAYNSGSCRDFAALFMEACRHLGLASRSVSGYLYTSDTDTGNASTHAWAEVYLPGAGWRGFDPTHGLAVADEHVPVAAASRSIDAAPIDGSYFGDAESSMQTEVSIRTS